MTRDEVKLCNCAGCDIELLGESMTPAALRGLSAEAIAGLPDRVKGRIWGRPYCGECLATRRKRIGGGRCLGRCGGPDENPWQQNAVRDLEDC